MKYVICTLPNASDVINYVNFVGHAEGKISAGPVSDADAEHFAAVPGFYVIDDAAAPATPAAFPVAPDFTPVPVDAAPAVDNANVEEGTEQFDEVAEAIAPAKNPVPANFQKKPAAK